jgi:hypothetical protein
MMNNDEELKNSLIRKKLYAIINILLLLDEYQLQYTVIDFLLKRAADLIEQLPSYEQQFYINTLRKQTGNI